jgi:hypothetical protein
MTFDSVVMIFDSVIGIFESAIMTFESADMVFEGVAKKFDRAVVKKFDPCIVKKFDPAVFKKFDPAIVKEFDPAVIKKFDLYILDHGRIYAALDKAKFFLNPELIIIYFCRTQHSGAVPWKLTLHRASTTCFSRIDCMFTMSTLIRNIGATTVEADIAQSE